MREEAEYDTAMDKRDGAAATRCRSAIQARHAAASTHTRVAAVPAHTNEENRAPNPSLRPAGEGARLDAHRRDERDRGGEHAEGEEVVVVSACKLGGTVGILDEDIDAGHKGVVLRFGEHIDTTGPGLHFKIPFGVDTVEKNIL